MRPPTACSRKTTVRSGTSKSCLPLGGGWLSGHYACDETPAGDSRLSDNPGYGKPYGARKRIRSVLDAARQIADGHGVSMAQMAPARLKRRLAVTSALLGASNRNQLADNTAAAELRLSDEDRPF